MNPNLSRCIVTVLVLASGSTVYAATPRVVPSDIAAPEKRRVSVELAAGLAQPAKSAPVGADLVNPFSPPGFELTDAEERAAAAAANVKTGQPGQAGPRVATDRETLARIAPQVSPNGTLVLPGGETVLVFGSKKLRVGTHLTVTFNNQDYDLELVRIDRTTYTLRLNREEITRPITKGKSP
jgi:hypothetical protein